jgi:hypothetical protein
MSKKIKLPNYPLFLQITTTPQQSPPRLARPFSPCPHNVCRGHPDLLNYSPLMPPPTTRGTRLLSLIAFWLARHFLVFSDLGLNRCTTIFPSRASSSPPSLDASSSFINSPITRSSVPSPASPVYQVLIPYLTFCIFFVSTCFRSVYYWCFLDNSRTSGTTTDQHVDSEYFLLPVRRASLFCCFRCELGLLFFCLLVYLGGFAVSMSATYCS